MFKTGAYNILDLWHLKEILKIFGPNFNGLMVYVPILNIVLFKIVNKSLIYKYHISYTVL